MNTISNLFSFKNKCEICLIKISKKKEKHFYLKNNIDLKYKNTLLCDSCYKTIKMDNIKTLNTYNLNIDKFNSLSLKKKKKKKNIEIQLELLFK